MTLVVNADGTVTAVYTEAVDLTEIGRVQCRRASHVEPSGEGWQADLSPIGGPVLGPFAKRSAALTAEVAWLDTWLTTGGVR
jgi:hypothetical protein